MYAGAQIRPLSQDMRSASGNDPGATTIPYTAYAAVNCVRA